MEDSGSILGPGADQAFQCELQGTQGDRRTNEEPFIGYLDVLQSLDLVRLDHHWIRLLFKLHFDTQLSIAHHQLGLRVITLQFQEFFQRTRSKPSHAKLTFEHQWLPIQLFGFAIQLRGENGFLGLVQGNKRRLNIIGQSLLPGAPPAITTAATRPYARTTSFSTCPFDVSILGKNAVTFQNRSVSSTSTKIALQYVKLKNKPNDLFCLTYLKVSFNVLH